MDSAWIDTQIWTGSSAEPWAQAMGVLGGRVAALGTTEAVLRQCTPQTQVRSLPGHWVVPGFNDAHVHLLEGGQGLLQGDFRAATSLEDFLDRLRQRAASAPKGQWILQARWDHERWAEPRMPTCRDLDRASPEHPVLLPRSDGHVAAANSLALRLAQISRPEQAPEGGALGTFPDGSLNGWVLDNAIALFDPWVEAADKHCRPALERAVAHAHSLGVTSVQNNASPDTWKTLRSMEAQGQLKLRVDNWFMSKNWDEMAELAAAHVPGDGLRLGSLKLYADGSMGARTAWLAEPYGDDGAQCGLELLSVKAAAEWMERAHRRGLRVAVHAIGDRANRQVLEAFSLLAEKVGTSAVRERRHRVEHVQLLRGEDLRLFEQLGLTASVQPIHAVDDLPWIEKRLGAGRLSEGGYRLRSLLEADIPVAVGSDWPVSSLDPARGMAACLRAAPKAPPWFSAEGVAWEDALRAYTVGSAYAEGQEHRKGKLLPGLLADFAVLQSPVGDFSFPSVGVRLTAVGGEVVYEAGAGR